MDNKYTKFFETNKATWDKKVSIHAKSEFYDVEGFKRGGTSLNQYELDEVGDVKGKSLLHLHCHFGQDTLSWSRLGAKCVGIDLSSEGIKQAKLLNKELDLEATFIECNTYDIPKKVEGKFDIIFASYGVIGWLPDLDILGEIIASKLNAGGIFYLIEFHPIVWMYDFLQTPPKLTHSYLKGDVIYDEYNGTYANNSADIVSKEYGWNHGLGEVVSALSNAGLHIEFLYEHEKSPYDCLPEMEKAEDGLYLIKKHKRMYPLLFSIKASKK